MMKNKCLCGQCTATIKSSTMFNWWSSSLFLVSCFEVYLSSEKSVIDLTSRLAGKLRNNFFAWQVKGMNALFGLHLQISVGESLIVGTAVSRFGCFYCCLLYILHCSNFKWRNNAYVSTCWCIAIVIKLLKIYSNGWKMHVACRKFCFLILLDREDGWTPIIVIAVLLWFCGP